MLRVGNTGTGWRSLHSKNEST